MKIYIIFILISFFLNPCAASENNSTNYNKSEINKENIIERTGIIEIAVILFISFLLSILISFVVEVHRNRCKTNPINFKNFQNNDVKDASDDLDSIFLNSDMDLANLEQKDYHDMQSDIEDEFVEIKINKDIYERLLLHSKEVGKNLIDELNEIIENALRNK